MVIFLSMKILVSLFVRLQHFFIISILYGILLLPGV